MNFRTKVELPAGILSVGYQNRLMSLGSCFSEHIGNRLSDAKFACDVNPFGILYNPFSIARALETLLDGRLYERDVARTVRLQRRVVAQLHAPFALFRFVPG